MAQDHVVFKIPDDIAPSTSKIDENDSAKTSSTTKNDEIEEISDEDNNENQTVVEESPKVEEPPKVEESPKDQIGGLRRRIGRIVKSGRLSSRKDDDGEDDRLMEEGYQDEDKKKPYFGVWIHGLIFFVIIGLFATTLKVPFLKGVKFWEVNLWKWVLLILFLICGGLISRWIVRVVVCIVEYKAPSMKKVLHVYIMSKIVEYFFWMVLLFTTWRCLFHERAKREKWTAYITKILIDFLAGVFVWLLKTLVVKVLTSNVYSTTYLERIKESLFDQFVIETLSGPPSAEIPKTGGRLSNGIGMDQLKKMDSNNVSARKMKKLINLVCEEKLTMMGEHARHIESEDGAKTVAQKIYENLDRRDDSFIYHEDVLKQYKVLNRKNLFDGAIDSGKISKSALEKWVMNAFRERRTLASALGNTKTIVKKVNRMLNALACSIILLICLIVIGIATTKILLILLSQIVLYAFVFGNTAKTMFEAVIFLFVMHPYDVGDRCQIDEIEMVVEEINIFTTIFLGYDNRKIIIPNNILATKPIQNFYRSPDMEDCIDFFIHVATSDDQISKIKRRVHSFVEENKDHWYPSPTIVFQSQKEQPDMVKLTIILNHRMNFQDRKQRLIRRSLVIEELRKIFKDLEIKSKMM